MSAGIEFSKFRRKHTELTQAKVSRSAKVNDGYLCRFEKGKPMSPAAAFRLAKAVGMPKPMLLVLEVMQENSSDKDYVEALGNLQKVVRDEKSVPVVKKKIGASGRKMTNTALTKKD